MTDWQDEIDRHVKELVRLTRSAAAERPHPLPEDEVAHLGALIATERQLLIDAIAGALREDEPEAASQPGVAEFDAGFCYGLAFASAIEDARIAIQNIQRGRLIRMVRSPAAGERKE